MKHLLPLFVLLSCSLLFTKTQAAHLVGGELSYQCLGADEYQLSLIIYRDCNCVACADFDDPANISIFNSSGFLIQNEFLFSPVITSIPIETEGLCIEAVPDVCVEQGVYNATVNLPPIAGGYQVVYQRCCRNNTIVNIVLPGETGSTYVLDIPEADSAGNCTNTSPVFNNFPPIVICANAPFEFDFSASDADGDELVYSFCDPYLGASTTDPAPPVASPPPYTPITWLPPYSAENPLGGLPAASIDPNTGILTCNPDLVGQFVVGICVTEYRDGVAINRSIRDFQFNVADCGIVDADANATDDITVCAGETVTLDASISGADDAYWSPEDGLSNPGSLTPSITPTETVTYVLIATNSATGCEDTDSVTIFVLDAPEINAGEDVQICAGEAVQLTATGAAVDANYAWSPSASLDDATSATPIATPTETTVYTVTVTTADGCVATDEVTVFADLESDPGTMPSDVQLICDGLTTSVTNNGDESLAAGHVLAYVLHTSATDVLGTVLAVNSQVTGGVFAITDASINTYETYYISAVAGPDAGTGLPELDNFCTNVNVGTPVVFFAPLELITNESCDWEFTGDYTIIGHIQGGYPQYDTTATYLVDGEFFDLVSPTANPSFVYVIAEGETNNFEINVTDVFCGSLAQHFDEFECAKTPIELTSFRGEAVKEGNFIAWSTATEINNDRFLLQRSSDGRVFNTIATIEGIGNSIIAQSYKYLDLEALNGISYYRLVQVDYNGTTSTSGTISVIRSEAVSEGIAINPIPSHDNITVAFNALQGQLATITVFSTDGRVVYNAKLNTQLGINQQLIPINDFSDGIYMLQISMPQQSLQKKFVKQ